jgi:hypothetical protein
MKMGRAERTEAVVKTTVYYPEKDVDALDPKNRFKALKIAKEISLDAVRKAVNNLKSIPDFSGHQDIKI